MHVSRPESDDPIGLSEKEQKAYYALSCARIWVRAVVEEGERCLAIRDRMRGPHPRDERELREAWHHNYWASGDFHADNERRIYSEHFFLIAIDKSVRWLEVAKSGGVPGIRLILKEYRVPLTYANEVRDMREHDDEYARGKGRAREKQYFQAQGGIADATGTIGTSTTYSLGNRVDLFAVMNAARAVASALSKIEPV